MALIELPNGSSYNDSLSFSENMNNEDVCSYICEVLETEPITTNKTDVRSDESDIVRPVKLEYTKDNIKVINTISYPTKESYIGAKSVIQIIEL